MESVNRVNFTDAFTYDANGNMTCRQESGVTYLQTYSAENRIASISKLASGTCAEPGDYAAKWDFTYDGDGVRTGQLYTPYENGQPQTPVLTRYFFGGALETSGSSVKKYYSLAGQTVAMKDADGFKYFLSDHLGSTSVVLDASGGILEQQRYLPFGSPRTDLGSPLIASTDFTYTGQRNLPDTGLMDYKARFYSVALGRFIQPDTLIPGATNPQNWNRYSYVQNRPINFSDPTGHWREEGCFENCSLPHRSSQPPIDPQDDEDDKPSPEDILKKGSDKAWDELTPEEQTILLGYQCGPNCWAENQSGGVHDAEFWMDPLFYLESLVIAGGSFRALVSLGTVGADSSIVSIGSRGLYERLGYTFFRLPTALYDTFPALGRLVNRVVIANQIIQQKPFVTRLFDPSNPGAGTKMEIAMLQAAQYVESTANWLGANQIFQPSTWQWIGKPW